VDYPTPEHRIGLTVVVDEPSRFYQRCDEILNARLLSGIRDSALRSGVPTQFCLLQDILDRKAAPSLVYIFSNAFHLDSEDRGRLREVLIEQNAAAIWMYASGYIDGSGSVENISATTGHTVVAFDEATLGGSQFRLDGGKWLEKDEAFGSTEEWYPLFYIDTDETKALAKYRDSGKTSVAIEFFEEGWASIYVAEPSLPPDLLREILAILEEHMYLRPESGGNDILHFGPQVLAIHANGNGEREMDLGDQYDVQDMLDTNVGWLDKRQVTIPMKTGTTHIFRLTAPIGSSDEVESGEQENDQAGVEEE
jgi:hypothetical protein